MFYEGSFFGLQFLVVSQQQPRRPPCGGDDFFSPIFRRRRIRSNPRPFQTVRQVRSPSGDEMSDRRFRSAVALFSARAQDTGRLWDGSDMDPPTMSVGGWRRRAVEDDNIFFGVDQIAQRPPG